MSIQVPELAVQATKDGLAVTREAPHPVFVVGASRADRTVLQAMLDAHRNISCEPETELLAGLTKVVEENLAGLASQGYPDQYWFKSAARYYANLQLDRAADRRRGRWVEIIDATTLPLEKLDRLFPTSRIIHVVGEGWTKRRSTHAIRAFAGTILSERYCEVQATELVAESATRRILGFLGESWDPTVLQTAPEAAQAA